MGDTLVRSSIVLHNLSSFLHSLPVDYKGKHSNFIVEKPGNQYFDDSKLMTWSKLVGKRIHTPMWPRKITSFANICSRHLYFCLIMAEHRTLRTGPHQRMFPLKQSGTRKERQKLPYICYISSSAVCSWTGFEWNKVTTKNIRQMTQFNQEV